MSKTVTILCFFSPVTLMKVNYKSGKQQSGEYGVISTQKSSIGRPGGTQRSSAANRVLDQHSQGLRHRVESCSH
jgi:hypothetical protein